MSLCAGAEEEEAERGEQRWWCQRQQPPWDSGLLGTQAAIAAALACGVGPSSAHLQLAPQAASADAQHDRLVRDEVDRLLTLRSASTQAALQW